MFNLEAVSVPRLYRVIADRIAQKIRDGEFVVGSRLPAERDLAEILCVSRSSVREALIALELSGYVEVRLGSGVYVTMPREEAIPGTGVEADVAPAMSRSALDIAPFELLEARLLIEPEVAAKTAQQADRQQLASIRDAQEAMSKGGAPNLLDRAFHAAIAAGCGNSALEVMVLSLRDLSETSAVYQRLGKHLVGRKAWSAAVIEHERIANAILDRDPIRARHEMYAHLVAVMARLREDFVDDRPVASAPAHASPERKAGRPRGPGRARASRAI